MRVLLSVALVACISTCGSKSPSPSAPTPPGSTPTPTAPALQFVTLTGNAATLTFRGETAQATATGTFSNGTTENITSTCGMWHSDNVGVLVVSSTGLMTAQGTGSSTITTTCQGTFATWLVTVTVGARTTFPAGQYLVGSDIRPGRYYSDPALSCYWQRQSGLGGTAAELLADESIDFNAGQWIVDVLSSDRAFETDANCGTWFPTQRRGLQADISPGVWLVGSQITPGRYIASVSSGCYWERMRHFQGTFTGVIANDFVNAAGQQLVQILASDAGFQTDDGCGTWTRVASVAPALLHQLDRAQTMSEMESNRGMRRRRAGLR